SYLHSFPFDKIKIDRSFVHELGENKHSTAIVRAITGLGKSLGNTTVARGAERPVRHGARPRLSLQPCSEVERQSSLSVRLRQR
ncbi:MAG TPA: EAL domain-containing protein, partial [Microvirga sp.]|nr:EAL domain-containing protein [Microvirga sp.]